MRPGMGTSRLSATCASSAGSPSSSSMIVAYRMLDPATQRVRVARDVVFDEGRSCAWDKAVDDGSATTLHDFIVEYAWA
jgi:hypothetical protein